MDHKRKLNHFHIEIAFLIRGTPKSGYSRSLLPQMKYDSKVKVGLNYQTRTLHYIDE